MTRFLLCCPLWLLLALFSPAQASVLDNLGQSILSGPTSILAIDKSRDQAISRQVSDTLLEQNALDGSASLSPHSGNQPSLFLMPVGRSDEVGIGIGIRFPF